MFQAPWDWADLGICFAASWFQHERSGPISTEKSAESGFMSGRSAPEYCYVKPKACFSDPP